MTMGREDLEALAAQLAPTFPGRDDAPLAWALLRELAHGAPADIGHIARVASRDERDVRDTLARWPNAHHDDERHVVAFGGLSIVPTAHRFEVGDRRLYAWCTWDTLFLPALLDVEARVASRCPITGTDVALTVAPDGVRETRPDWLWVSFPSPAQTTTTDIAGSFCCHVHFLAGAAAAERWASADAGIRADAFELGRLATQAFSAAGAIS